MEIFTEKKMWKRVTYLLVFINALFFGILIWKFNGHRHEPELFPSAEYRDVSGVLKEELQLSEKQAEQIKNLRAFFFEKERQLAIIIRQERDSMNASMFNKNTDETLIKNLALEISQNEYKMELLRYEQAQQLKAICTPEQLEKFEHLVLEIRDYFRPDNQPKKKSNN